MTEQQAVPGIIFPEALREALLAHNAFWLRVSTGLKQAGYDGNVASAWIILYIASKRIVRFNELNRAGLFGTNVHHNIKMLQKRGYITFQDVATDGRGRSYKLTEAGVQFARDVHKIVQDWEASRHGTEL